MKPWMRTTNRTLHTPWRALELSTNSSLVQQFGENLQEIVSFSWPKEKVGLNFRGAFSLLSICRHRISLRTLGFQSESHDKEAFVPYF